MGQIELAYGLPEETYCYNDALQKYQKQRSANPIETSTSSTVTGVLQGDTLAPYLFILCLDYILWTWIDLIKNK